MPPVLDPHKSEVDGLVFLGLSLSRKDAARGHPNSVTHQTAFDLNEVQDRDYKFLFSTSDDGWLVGGGEPGPPTSYKLEAPDSAHVEIMRIGTYNPSWGGVKQEDIVEAMQSGKIFLPPIHVVPTRVVANGDNPPELEIRFDMEPSNFDNATEDEPLPVNWQLRFLHNQLFEHFSYPSRFCPGAFHSTILRKAEFRSETHREQYFAKCYAAVQSWRKCGVQPLIPEKVSCGIEVVQCALPSALQQLREDSIASVKITVTSTTRQLDPMEAARALSKEDEDFMSVNGYDEAQEEKKDAEAQVAVRPASPALEEQQTGTSPSTRPEQSAPAESEATTSADAASGVWLFTDRNTITHQFLPNFMPPYTGEKRKIIAHFLSKQWDQDTLQWETVTKVTAVATTTVSKKYAEKAEEDFAKAKKGEDADAKGDESKKAIVKTSLDDKWIDNTFDWIIRMLALDEEGHAASRVKKEAKAEAAAASKAKKEAKKDEAFAAKAKKEGKKEEVATAKAKKEAKKVEAAAAKAKKETKKDESAAAAAKKEAKKEEAAAEKAKNANDEGYQGDITKSDNTKYDWILRVLALD